MNRDLRRDDDDDDDPIFDSNFKLLPISFLFSYFLFFLLFFSFSPCFSLIFSYSPLTITSQAKCVVGKIDEKGKYLEEILSSS